MKMSIKTLNFALGITGLLIIWFATHSIVAVLGGIIAGVHITTPNK